MMPTFLIDACFLLRNTIETFWGTPLVVVDGKDNTFCFGFARDFLRLRNSLHISDGAVVFGGEAFLIASEKGLHSVMDMCRGLGVVVIDEPKTPALAIVATYADRFSDVVTDDPRMLSFCTERRTVHLGKNLRSIEKITSDGVQRSLGVTVEHVPTYLALTEGAQHGRTGSSLGRAAVTTREARRLVELYGSLPSIYQHLSTIKSPALKKKLVDYESTFYQRYHINTPTSLELSTRPEISLEWTLDGKDRELLLRSLGFYSLVRMLTLPNKKDELAKPATDRVRPSERYQAVLNCREFNDLLERVALSKVCAIDTEADDKDPRTANLLGIAFALGPGDAFFVPFCERELGDLTVHVIARGLTKLFEKRIRFVGHNLKYDLTLLGRNAISPPAVCFDTLLAAHDCYGDLDFFNLSFLAQRLLGRRVKTYKDIVPKEKTFLELPFREMKGHACTDADVALQLHTYLERELKLREIDRQFEEQTMPLAHMLLKLEKDGILVDGKRLEQLRSWLIDRMLELKKRASDSIGNGADLDSREELRILITKNLGLRVTLGRNSLTQSWFEHLASQQPSLKPVVEYRRTAKQLRRVESIGTAMRRGRVYPLLNQTRNTGGGISSTDPDLFADDGLERLNGCISGAPAVWFRDGKRSLDLAQEVSGDVVLKKDRGGSGRLNLFMNGQRSMNGVAHDDLLLRVLIGEPAHQLSARFLMDKVEIGNIVHVLETRYREVFRYIADARMQGLKRGYVERAGKRRYLEGFGSSNIEKRNTAQVTCCRWLLQY